MTLNNSIEARIAAIAEAIKRRAMEEEAPADDLSKSLFEFGRELAALDEAGLAAKAEAWGIAPEDLREMTRMYANKGYDTERKAMEYARKHLQAVHVCWVDRQPTECGAVEAVELCADRGVSGRVVGVVARDKTLEDVLNKLLDGEQFSLAFSL